MRRFSRPLGAILAAVSLLTARGTLGAEQQVPQPEQIQTLVRQLNDDESAVRDQAEHALLKLAPTHSFAQYDAFLALLPRPVENMPAEVRLRLTRIRREIETAGAKHALMASKLTLSAQTMKLGALLDEVHRQTGNRLSDYRQQFGQEATELRIALDAIDGPFWPGMDRILDRAELGLYTYSGQESLAVIQREQGAAPRAARASYAGPFRIEAVNVVSQRSLRLPDQQGGHVEIEIAWEPRLHPIALSQPAASLKITADDGSQIQLGDQRSEFAVEVQPGSHATELNIPFVLPKRSVSKLASLRGELSALVPGRVVEFRFENLDQEKRAESEQGGVKVVIDRVHLNQQLWEVHMRLQVESDEAALQSHRGWVFQNLTYLLNKQGDVIDHAGFETTMQSEREIGLAYFFDLPDAEIGDYTWVYRTPAAIVRVPVKFELKDILLP